VQKSLDRAIKFARFREILRPTTGLRMIEDLRRVGWRSSGNPFGDCRRQRKENRQSDIQHKAGSHAEPCQSHARQVEKWSACVLL
jgi:hypothetical protein